MGDMVRAVEAWRPRGYGESFMVRVPEELLEHEFVHRAAYQFVAGLPAPRIVEVPAHADLGGDVVEVAKAALIGVTDGPWRWALRPEGEWGPISDQLVSETSRSQHGGMTYGGESSYPTAVLSAYPNDDQTVDFSYDRENAHFIALSRTLVPELVSEVERLRAEVERVRELIQEGARVEDIAAALGDHETDE